MWCTMRRQPREGLPPHAAPHLLGEAAGEEGVEVLGIQPHEALQVLPLVDVRLVLLLRQLRQVLRLDGVALGRGGGEEGERAGWDGN